MAKFNKKNLLSKTLNVITDNGSTLGLCVQFVINVTETSIMHY
jgi:hypothetical protein